MKLEAYILSYLKNYGLCKVPGFGTFLLENVKAMVSADGSDLLPPSKTVVFNEDFEQNNTDLASFVASEEKIPLSTALKEIEYKVANWKEKYELKQEFDIENLGNFNFSNNRGNFNGKRIAVDAPEFYGLEEIKINELKKGATRTNKQHNPEYKFSKLWVWPTAFLAMALALFYEGKMRPQTLFGKKSFQEGVHLSPQKKIIKIDSAIKKTADSINQNPPAQKQPIKRWRLKKYSNHRWKVKKHRNH